MREGAVEVYRYDTAVEVRDAGLRPDGGHEPTPAAAGHARTRRPRTDAGFPVYRICASRGIHHL